MEIYSGADMYVKEDTINNSNLEANLWTPGDMAILFGVVNILKKLIKTKKNF